MDLTGTWWKSRRDGHRVQIVGVAAGGRLVAHRVRKDGWTHTYSVSRDYLQQKYRQVRPPRKKAAAPDVGAAASSCMEGSAG